MQLLLNAAALVCAALVVMYFVTAVRLYRYMRKHDAAAGRVLDAHGYYVAVVVCLLWGPLITYAYFEGELNDQQEH